MDLGAILLPASTAERHPAVLVGTPQRNTEIIAIPLAHGASTVIRSTDVQKPVRPVARLPMIMQITAIPTVRGRKPMIRSTSARKPAPLAAIPAKNMQTTPMRTAMESATIAVQLSA